ncbi:hypothetical protein F5X96DRAFT_451634 [Biscogniauxia mediterranea]|nr:hypothetical protein F5X96DRAFT_451634 [Biscogniauxia mediterranea]
MASLVGRPSRRAGAAVVVDPAPSGRQPTTKPSPKPLITLPSPTITTTTTSSSSPSSVPGWLSHPLRRLRWLYARIRAERHDRSSSALPLRDPFIPFPLPSSSSSSTPSSPTEEPNHHHNHNHNHNHHHDDSSEWRPRSFREILGRKLLEAEQQQQQLPLAELLERAAENLLLLCWWEGEWACCAAAWWAFRALVPARWQGLAGAPWWWRGCVCAWWAEVLVSRNYHYQHEQNPCLRRVGAYVGRGDAVIVAAAGRRRRDGGGDRWGDAVAGRLDDLVELTAVLGGISWCFVCFYLGAAKARVMAYPRSVGRSAWRALGVVDGHQRCRLDIELLELD